MRSTLVKVQAESVQVWRADLGQPPVGMDALALTLSGDERARAGRFHRPRDRDRFVAACGLLRVLLGAALLSLPPGCRPSPFCQVWVRDEAYLKALGTGFSSPARPPKQGQWTCLDLDFCPDYRASLVVSAKQTAPGAI